MVMSRTLRMGVAHAISRTKTWNRFEPRLVFVVLRFVTFILVEMEMILCRSSLTQEVGRWLLVAAISVRCQVGLCWICGEQTGTNMGLSQSTFNTRHFRLFVYPFTCLSIHLLPTLYNLNSCQRPSTVHFLNV